MQTTPEGEALLDDLVERIGAVDGLTGPQVEAWASGLFPLFDDSLSVEAFADRCAHRGSAAAHVVIAALVELTEGLGAGRGAQADALLTLGEADKSPIAAQVGTSEIVGAWRVKAPFGESYVLACDNATPIADVHPHAELTLADEPVDLRHSILVEVDDSGALEDLQLAGPAFDLLDEASAADGRVVVTELEIADAVARIIDAWPTDAGDPRRFGPGVSANQQFVRRRILKASGTVLHPIELVESVVDVRRGLDDAEYADANRAALSTLRAALRIDAPAEAGDDGAIALWAAIIRGDAGDLSVRERDALLWLEWADWLGAGIGLSRAGAGVGVDGEVLVDLVNRCPEVSSTISKADRDYAAWAFSIALELLEDVSVIEGGHLTAVGHASVVPALFRAWS